MKKRNWYGASDWYAAAFIITIVLWAVNIAGGDLPPQTSEDRSFYFEKWSSFYLVMSLQGPEITEKPTIRDQRMVDEAIKLNQRIGALDQQLIILDRKMSSKLNMVNILYAIDRKMIVVSNKMSAMSQQMSLNATTPAIMQLSLSDLVRLVSKDIPVKGRKFQSMADRDFWLKMAVAREYRAMKDWRRWLSK